MKQTLMLLMMCLMVNINSKCRVKFGLHDAIYLTDSSVFTLRYCVNFNEMRYVSTSFNRIVADIMVSC